MKEGKFIDTNMTIEDKFTYKKILYPSKKKIVD
jgi:hypothetical protein